jgi:hypothetical protein
MGLVLDSGVLIAAERDARPVSELLAKLERELGEAEIALFRFSPRVKLLRWPNLPARRRSHPR